VDFQDWEQPPSDSMDVTEDFFHLEAEGTLIGGWRKWLMSMYATTVILALNP